MKVIIKRDNIIFKKLKASTIVETLVASLIIIIIFTMASMTLNNVFKASIKKNTSLINYRLNKINYLLQNNKLSIPYSEEFNGWNITIDYPDRTKQSLNIYAVKGPKQIEKSCVYVGY